MKPFDLIRNSRDKMLNKQIDDSIIDSISESTGEAVSVAENTTIKDEIIENKLNNIGTEKQKEVEEHNETPASSSDDIITENIECKIDSDVTGLTPSLATESSMTQNTVIIESEPNNLEDNDEKFCEHTAKAVSVNIIENDLIEMVDGRFVIKRSDGSYPSAFRWPLFPAEQPQEDERFREDISANISEVGLYRIYAASLRGVGKRRKHGSEIRQDGYAVGFAGDRWVICAVADGVSAASKSHILADYLAKYAVAQLEQLLENRESMEGVSWNKEAETMKTAAYEYCRNKCEQQHLFGPYIDYFASTLEFVVVGVSEENSGEYAYVSVSGDGNCYIFSDKGFVKELKNGKGGEGNRQGNPHSEAVNALPEDPGNPHVVYGVLGERESLLITTDGYSKIGRGETQVAKYLFKELNEVSSISSYLQVMDFDAYQNDDDRTGIMIRRKKHGNRY